MDKQEVFEGVYAELNDMKPEDVKAHRLVHSYRDPRIARAWRYFLNGCQAAAEDAQRKLSECKCGDKKQRVIRPYICGRCLGEVRMTCS